MQSSTQISIQSSTQTSIQNPPHSRQPTALSPEDLQAIAHQLLDQSWGARDFTPQEVAYALGYRGHQLRPERLTPLITALEADGSPFRKHPRLPNAYLVRVTPDGSLVLRGVKRPRLARADRLDVPLTQALIEQAFKDCAHQPYKVRFPHQERRCELRFHFPEVALKECGDEVEWLRGHLGEALSVSGEVHQEALVQRTLDLMPTPWRTALYRIPSLHLSAKEVSARVCLVAIESWALAEVEEGLYSHTGFRFRLNLRPDLTPIFGPTLSSAHSSVQRSALSSVQRSAHASGDSPAPSLSPLSLSAPSLSAPSLSQGLVNDERLSLFSPERLITPAPRGAKRRYKQAHAINEVRRYCKGHARPLKTLRPYKNHLELVFKGPPPSDELKGALKAIADASGWGLAIEVGS